MAPLSTVTRTLARSAVASARLPTATTARAMSSSPALRDATSSYESPFKGESTSSKIPDFSKYMSKGKGGSNALISYFMVGTLGAISAAGAKSTVQGEFFCLLVLRSGVRGLVVGAGIAEGGGGGDGVW